ncbi:ADAMTS metallopeptidase stall [Brevipalpus obovatus]|uniref:ADAMTS metallopeptidase stall n=1 Tax=Brevipalpus obovatus TaxID=246614 RepID=UPI003D9F7896
MVSRTILIINRNGERKYFFRHLSRCVHIKRAIFLFSVIFCVINSISTYDARQQSTYENASLSDQINSSDGGDSNNSSTIAEDQNFFIEVISPTTHGAMSDVRSRNGNSGQSDRSPIQDVKNIFIDNRSLETNYCDLAFINDADRKEIINNYVEADDSIFESESYGSSVIRNKRALAKIYTIETAIFVDPSLANRFEGRFDELKRLIMAIMNEVQLIYEYSSMRTRIRIIVVKYEVLTQLNGPNTAEGDIDQYLDNFCAWQARRYRQENWNSRWDHALMLTGLDLFKDMGNKKRNKKVLGLAWVNGMCKPSYSCTLNEGKSFEAAFVIAHELGHSLGILHDGRGNNCDPEKYIMSEKTGPGKVNWSPCSNVYINNFMARGNGRCLENIAMSAGDLDFRRTNRLPGEQFPANIQCQLALGSDYRAYVTSKEPFRSICRELWCISGNWATPAHPALEGSQCAPNGERCYQGDCSFGFTRDAIAEHSRGQHSDAAGNQRSNRRWTRNRGGTRNRRPVPIGGGSHHRLNSRRGTVAENIQKDDQIISRSAGASSGLSGLKNSTKATGSTIKNQNESGKSSTSIFESIRDGFNSFTNSAKNFFSNLFS